MKIFILTCINESSELVYAKAFKTLQGAKAEMFLQATAEHEEFAIAGRPGLYCDYGDMSTACGDQEYCYVWNITEDVI